MRRCYCLFMRAYARELWGVDAKIRCGELLQGNDVGRGIRYLFPLYSYTIFVGGFLLTHTTDIEA